MLKYRCLVLDHDDTVVQSEKTIAFPCFQKTLAEIRPGIQITLEEYLTGCHNLGFVNMCRQTYGFTDEELHREYLDWQEYIHTHIPAHFSGMENIIRRQKESGGLLFVVSHSSQNTILRDYHAHFSIEPDGIYGCDLPPEKQKPSPYPLEDIMARYSIQKEEILVVDDMKPAWEMARRKEVAIAFAAWGKTEFPFLCKEMQALCDFTFSSPQQLEAFLFP